MAKKKPEAQKPLQKADRALTNTASKPLAKASGGKLTGRGFENIDKSDLLLPRVKLLQPLSPEVGDLGEKPGTIFLSLSNMSLGNKIALTPIMHFRSRIKWTPEDDGGGIDCSSPDAKIARDPSKYSATCAACSFTEWDDTQKVKKDKAPKCTLYDNFLVLVGDSNEPLIIPFERSKSKVAKKWYSIGALRGGDMWDNQYELSVVGEKSEDGKPYFNYSIKDLAKKTKPEQLARAESIWASLIGKTISESNTDKERTTSAAPEAHEAVASGKY